MVSLPINVVNLICEWSAHEDIDWYPFFCPKTHNLSWKVNKYSRKFVKNGDIILHNTLDTYSIEGFADILNYNTMTDDYHLDYKGIMFQFIDGSFNLYVSIDTERDISKKDKYIYRAMLKFDISDESDNLIVSGDGNEQNVYLNGTNYGIIIDGCYSHKNKKLVLFIHKI